MAGGANQYKQMSIKTASRGQILIMLYEAAIQNCKKAVEAIEKKDIPTKCKHIGKVHDIVLELQSSLDHSVGGQIAEDLERLYNFMGSQLIKANAESSSDTMKQIQKLLETLLVGWRGAVEQVQKGGTPQK
jgi:flagellar protein FliS